MTTSRRAVIKGLGAYIPEKVLTNADLEKMVETSDEWIKTRTGIEERHIADESQSASDLGLEAAKIAIKDAGISVDQIDLILVATITPDMFFPSTACNVQHKLGANCGAFDLAAACSGFPYGLAVADAFIKAGMYKNVLVIGSEVLSKFIDWKDRSTCVLFGDGAGAAIVSAVESEEHVGILTSDLGSDGGQAEILKIPAGGSVAPPSEKTIKEGQHYLKMQGSEVFKIAVRTMEQAVANVLEKEGLKLEDINCLIPHQANSRILKAVADRLKLGEDQVYINVERYGNMSSASAAVALYEAVKEGKIKKGDNVVIVAFGGGLTWAATLIKW